MAGVSRSCLTRWEGGEDSPRPEAAVAWAEALRRLGFKV